MRAIQYKETAKTSLLAKICHGNARIRQELYRRTQVGSAGTNHVEKALFLSILPYVAYLSCCIQDKDGRDIGLNEMERISGMTKKTVIKALQGLIEKDILYRGKAAKVFNIRKSMVGCKRRVYQ